VTDVAAFLLARIADDEAAARAATPGPWHGGDDQGRGVVNADQPDPSLNEFPDWQARSICNESAFGDIRPENAVHIARHDPARVLADCAAKRAIVERHILCEEENQLYSARFDRYAAWAEEAGMEGEDEETAAAFAQVEPQLPSRVTTPFETDGLRIAVRLLAQPYATHADFDPAWKLD
jgi:Family of unknown function (DUF6221)